MNETFCEVLVKRKTPWIQKFGKNILIVVTVIFVLLYLLTGNVIIMFPAVGFGAVAYFVNQKISVEYEYSYMDKELDIDVIYAMQKRKHATTIDLTKLEVLAPETSYHLDDYKRRQCKPRDFSSKNPANKAKVYVMYLSNNDKVIFEPSEGMVKAIANIAPRKVFTE